LAQIKLSNFAAILQIRYSEKLVQNSFLITLAAQVSFTDFSV